MLKFIHIADLHLGISYDTLPPEKALRCQETQLEAFSQAISLARTRSVDAVLIAGDLFATPTPPPAIFRRAMELIAGANCPVILSPGNHDHICAECVYLREQLPNNFHVFTETVLQPYPVNAECIVWGAAFDGTTASISLRAPLAPALQNICVVHSDLKTNSKYNHYDTSEIAASGFRYLAVGHNHAASPFKQAGNTWYSCPGALVATKSSETGSKGYFYIELDEEEIHFETIDSGGIEFDDFSIDISPILSDVALQEVLIRKIPKYHDRIITTLTFTGERTYSPNFPALSRALDRIFFHCTIRDETTEKKPLWRYLQNDDLRGRISRSFRDKIETARDETERADFTRALQYALAAFENDSMPLF